MRGQCAVVFVVAGLIVTATAAPASAAPALVAVDDSTPTVEANDDGERSGKVGLTNLTDSALTLSARPTSEEDSDCKPRLSRAAIGAAQSSEPELVVPKECELTDDMLEVTVVVAPGSGTATQEVPLVAEVKAVDDEPDWDELLVFPIALGIAAIVLVCWFSMSAHGRAGERLEHLEATYDFKESWVSNVTVIAAILTGVFGSEDAVKAVLGEDADRSIALATVGSAIALIFIGSGPIVLTAAKSQFDAKGELAPAYTVGGLHAAMTVTVAGALGQLWIGWKSAQALELGGVEDWITAGFWFAVALLAWYTLATSRATLTAGTTAPKPKPSELAQLIALVKEALKKNTKVPVEVIPFVVEDVRGVLPAAVPATAGSPRRRAAML